MPDPEIIVGPEWQRIEIDPRGFMLIGGLTGRIEHREEAPAMPLPFTRGRLYQLMEIGSGDAWYQNDRNHYKYRLWYYDFEHNTNGAQGEGPEANFWGGHFIPLDPALRGGSQSSCVCFWSGRWEGMTLSVGSLHTDDVRAWHNLSSVAQQIALGNIPYEPLPPPDGAFNAEQIYIILHVGDGDMFQGQQSRFVGQLVRIRNWEGRYRGGGYTGCGLRALNPYWRYRTVTMHSVLLEEFKGEVPEYKPNPPPKERMRPAGGEPKLMEEKTVDIKIENGGGNLEAVWDLVWHTYRDFLYDCDGAAGLTHDQRLVLRKTQDDLYTGISHIDLDKFYTEKGAKITRPIKELLVKHIGKEATAPLFAAFCKAVGELYATVDATATLHPVYFTNGKMGSCGDSDSCFGPGGCNSYNGRFIDKSMSMGVITIAPKDARYAKGRVIFWILDATHAHILNKYSRSGERELPYSVFVRALEVLSGATLSFAHKSGETLPIYVNHGYHLCTAIDGNFSSITEDFRWVCPACGHRGSPNSFESESDGTRHSIGCCQDCLGAQEEDDDNMHTCVYCEEIVHDDDVRFPNDEPVCTSCYDEHFFSCAHCGNSYDNDNGVEVHRRGRSVTVCSGCYENCYAECPECEEQFEIDKMIGHDEEYYCSSCADNCLGTCITCKETFKTIELDADDRCENCAEEAENDSKAEARAS
jgi:hypothetical protein